MSGDFGTCTADRAGDACLEKDGIGRARRAGRPRSDAVCFTLRVVNFVERTDPVADTGDDGSVACLLSSC